MSIDAEALPIAEQLAVELDTPEALRHLAGCLDRLAATAAAAGDWDTATALLARCLLIVQEIAGRVGTAAELRTVLDVLDRLVDAQYHQNCNVDAEVLRELADIREVFPA